MKKISDDRMEETKRLAGRAADALQRLREFMDATPEEAAKLTAKRRKLSGYMSTYVKRGAEARRQLAAKDEVTP
ncbi:hypothetical protein [Anaeromyxobacter terrae]|uniref:hypothetical protein n=1 Tax=Anaeromyxobacter terrae TaxID=2925406 RepID=UPI001F564123|nr:hypothetical protein [Anaeromyxobacter sp. SG22]